MDPEGESQPTQPTQQATQNVLDPRRLGKQNSGFTDEDISDIICVLIPCTENARREVARIANENSQHLVGRDEAENADLDYSLEDEASRFGGLIPHDGGGHAIALRLSAAVKNPLQGFAFGRNLNRCDICFKEDPCRRLSNIHFRIFLNEYGVLMLEDQSTNGTIVDDHLLKSRSRNPVDTKRMLQSGSKISILMHRDTSDLAFRVRVPRRDGDYEVAYRRNLGAYLQHLKEIAEDQEQTISAGPDGHVDIFSGQGRGTLKGALSSKQRYIALPNEPTQDGSERLAREWNGSDKYHRVGQIGKGAFATVHKVTSKYDGMPYAAKELDKRRFMKNGVLDQKVENEMKIMQRVRHPNIVQYIEHIDWLDRSLIIIMELVPGGDLGGWIGSRGRLPEPTVKVMAQQLINALGYLHENNITHRDVKPDNILIQSTQPFVVKLTDFGLSKMIDKEETFLRTFCGTLLYCAPEVYSEYAEYDEYGRRNPRNKSKRAMPGQRYDHAVDIWSLGGVLFYALTGSPPYPVRTGISYSELLHQIMTKQLDISPLVQANVTGDGISFLVDMLQRRPEKRATVQMLQEHPWLGGPGSMRPPQSLKASFDEVSDDQLEQSASQLSLADRQTKQIPSDDEILDDDFFEENNESEKENYTFMPGNQGQRLFGEVNVSAIGSSGVIPSNRLNLPLSGSSYSGTDILDSEIRDSFESQKLSTPKQQPRSQKSQNRSSGGVPLSAAKSYSVDALNNMTFDVESQSLGGAESFLDNLNMKSTIGGELLGRSMSEFNTSKRKPAYDTSDEYEGAQMPEKPTIKRLKSEVALDLPSDVEDAENLLYTLIPPISRIQSGRQMDSPVHKSIYWVAGDKKSWHLRYPEMTQLQHDAFKEAAARRGEEFAEGKSPLWDLAMKFFPPVEASFEGDSPLGPSDNGAPLTVDTKLESKEQEPVPSTAAPDDDDIPDTAPTETNIIVPVLTPAKRVVASMQSSSSSVVQNVSIAVTESVTSWGRALENTRVYQARQEVRVPKYAFKLLLWKEAYDPSREFRPWNLVSGGDDEASSYHFYISTKATNGIRVNDTLLESHEPKRPDAPSRHWIRLQDGDAVTVWNSGDASRPMQPGQQRTTLVFRCGWGGSARPRSQAPSSQAGTAAALVPDAIARRLDEACARAEKRVHVLAESELKMAEADADVAARSRHIERERQRSRAFEARRLEACRLLRAGTGSSSSRRTSPAPAALPDTAGPSSHVAGVVVSPPPPLQVLQGQGQGQGGYLSGKTVVMGQPPGLMRHGSPLKDALVAMAEAEEEMKRR